MAPVRLDYNVGVPSHTTGPVPFILRYRAKRGGMWPLDAAHGHWNNLQSKNAWHNVCGVLSKKRVTRIGGVEVLTTYRDFGHACSDHI